MEQEDLTEKSSGAGRHKSKQGLTLFEIAVGSVGQLFDMRDPAPFRNRDLDDDLVEYIVSRTQELPPDTAIGLRFILTNEVVDPAACRSIEEAVRSYFSYQASILKQKMNENFRMGRTYLLMGLSALVVCLSISEFITVTFAESTLRRIAHEGFMITGWVAMWRPLEVFLYGWWPFRADRKIYLRLTNATIEVIHRPSPV